MANIHQFFISILLALICEHLAHAGQWHPDKSTESDSVFFEAKQMKLSGGTKLDDKFITFPVVKYPEVMPGISVRYKVPEHGYYIVSAWGKPEKALWKGYDFVEFHCHFGDDFYRMKTALYGERFEAETPGKYQELCRFYFIAHQPGEIQVRLQIKYTTRWVKVDRLEIRHIDRHLSKKIVKDRASLYTEERLKQLKEAGIPVAGGGVKPEKLKETDDETWRSIPDWRSMRVYTPDNMNCPECGQDIRQVHAIYPWHFSSPPGEEHRKCYCKVCKKFFPTNDYHAGDMTSGKYPDDGMGWFDLNADTPAAKSYDPKRSSSYDQFYYPNYFWVGHVAHVTLRATGDILKAFAAEYRNNGDERFAWKGSILLARMAYVYPCMDWSWQSIEGLMWSRPDSIHGRHGKITHYTVEPQIFVLTIEAYDLLFDYIKGNEKLAKYVSTKVPWIKSPDDLLLMLDRNLIQLGSEILEKVVKSYAAESWYMLGSVARRPDWFLRGFDNVKIQLGKAPAIWAPTNLLNRDGNSQQTFSSYDLGAVLQNLGKVAHWIDLFDDKSLSRDYDFWHGEPFAKLRASLDKYPSYMVAGDGWINGGDSQTTSIGFRHRNIPHLGRAQQMYAYAYKHLRKPEYAYWAKGRAELIPFALKGTHRAIRKAARDYKPPVHKSRHQAGHGTVILEANTKGNLMQRAGIASRYGPSIREHQHKDAACNFEYFAKGIVVSPDFGWPPGTSSPDRHNVVQIDDWVAFNGAGRLLAMAQGQRASYADLYGVAMRSRSEVSSLIRRRLALMEVGDSDSYLIDLVRTRGGRKKHSYHFHGTQGDLSLDVKGDVVATWKVDMKAIIERERNPEIKKTFADQQLYYRMRVLGSGNRNAAKFKVNRADFPNSNLASVVDQTPPVNGQKESTFIGIAQPYGDAPFIQEVIDLYPQQKGIQLPRGVVVKSRSPSNGDTLVDTHLFAGGRTRAKGNRVVLDGSYGFCREKNGKPEAWILVGDTNFLDGRRSGTASLKTPTLNINLKPDFFKGTVAQVNWKTGALKVKGEIPDKATGRTVTLRTPASRVTTYNVVSSKYDAASDKSSLVLENFFPVGVCDVRTIDSQGGLIQTGQQPRFGSATGYHFAFGTFLDGLWLVDESRSRQALLASYGNVKGHVGPWFKLSNPADVTKLPDAPGHNFGPLGEKEHLIFLYDAGVGDEVFFVPSVSVLMKDDGTLDVQSTGHARLKDIRR